MAERGGRRSSQLYSGAGFVLVGSDQAIQHTQQQQAAQYGGNLSAATQHNLPELAQRRCRVMPANFWPVKHIGPVRQILMSGWSVRQRRAPQAQEPSRRDTPCDSSRKTAAEAITASVLD